MPIIAEAIGGQHGSPKVMQQRRTATNVKIQPQPVGHAISVATVPTLVSREVAVEVVCQAPRPSYTSGVTVENSEDIVIPALPLPSYTSEVSTVTESFAPEAVEALDAAFGPAPEHAAVAAIDEVSPAVSGRPIDAGRRKKLSVMDWYDSEQQGFGSVQSTARSGLLFGQDSSRVLSVILDSPPDPSGEDEVVEHPPVADSTIDVEESPMSPAQGEEVTPQMSFKLCNSPVLTSNGEPQYADAWTQEMQKAKGLKEGIQAAIATSGSPLLAGADNSRQLGLRPVVPDSGEEPSSLQAELLVAKDAAKRADTEVQALKAALAEAEATAARNLGEQTASMQKELQAAKEDAARESQEKESLKAELMAAKQAAKLILYSDSPLPLRGTLGEDFR